MWDAAVSQRNLCDTDSSLTNMFTSSLKLQDKTIDVFVKLKFRNKIRLNFIKAHVKTLKEQNWQKRLFAQIMDPDWNNNPFKPFQSKYIIKIYWPI